MRRHVIVRETKDARRRIAVAADARHAHPTLGRDDPPRFEQILGVFSEAMHFVGGECVGELERFAQAHEPLAFGVVEVGEAIANGARVPTIERDELFGRELRMPAQRFEDAADVVVGDECLSAVRYRLRARPAFSFGRSLHGWK